MHDIKVVFYAENKRGGEKLETCNKTQFDAILSSPFHQDSLHWLFCWKVAALLPQDHCF
jgi:hypothetical protein